MPAGKDAAVEEEGIKLVGRAEAAMHNVHDMDYDTIGLSEHIGMLNEDQRSKFPNILIIYADTNMMNANVKISNHCTCLSVVLEVR